MTIIPQPDQALAAIRDAEAIGAHLNDFSSAFGALAIDRMADPELNPAFYAKVRDLTHRLRVADVDYVDYAPVGSVAFDPDNPAMLAVPLLHYAGDPQTVHVLRDTSTVRGFMGLYTTRMPVGHCDLAEAADCHGDDALGIYVSVTRPPVVIVWEACGPCLEHLEAVAWSGDVLSEADERGRFAKKARAAVERWAR